MRRLIVTEFITLDGVVEAPGGEKTHPHAGWTFPFGTDELFAFKLRETLEAESLLLGRKTFEQFQAAWPERDGEFADTMNAMPKHVVTARTDELGWNATRLAGDARAAVGELKRGDGGPILVAGSATLVRSLLVWGLVDQLRLLSFPVIVGGGLRIFPDDRAKAQLELTELVRFESGAVLHVYDFAGN
ncbi:dihydrofolate reductase family protein [Leifsonia poae]|uniref:dihydrofolate reductase family protein n=1 Tax=Leifsonia poae TaxID=110933 RepID=UPI001CC1468C|nr:dihydrofolate reductase family protein [Leifsonia poae]